ncbi:AmmeMemoRadiSam system protein B [Candidatus Woesearchaeota archaeon]|nr:AmmeMemoRadiSam system protein B [Candidatus Woesearchaeota archaeon]
MTRESVVAGAFYEDTFDKLTKQIEECFASKLGPGDLPTKRDENKSLRAVVVPHAGYAYSGACAAWAYKKIGESKFSDTYIIIGPNHRDTGSAISIEDWKTPLGIVRNDKDLTRIISEKTKISIDDSKHASEHSIEVQLPFLQFVSKDRLTDLRIVPITLSHDIKISEFANNLREAIDESKKEVMIILSTDFTHYGRNYGYIPFELDAQQKIKELDTKTISFIKENDVKGLINHLEETQSTVCGQIPVIVLMQTLKEYKTNLEMYYTSYEVSGDKKNSVSYASITFK